MIIYTQVSHFMNPSQFMAVRASYAGAFNVISGPMRMQQDFITLTHISS